MLVVCCGNICRSRLRGRAFLRDRVGGAIEVRSTGFHPKVGRPSLGASRRAVSSFWRMSLEKHADSSRHLGRRTDSEADIDSFLDWRNWAALIEAGADPGTLVWLGSLVAGPVEIKDPYRAERRRCGAPRSGVCLRRDGAVHRAHRRDEITPGVGVEVRGILRRLPKGRATGGTIAGDCGGLPVYGFPGIWA